MNKKMFSVLILSMIMLLSSIALSEQQQPELTIDQAQAAGLRSYIAISDYGPLVVIRDDGTCNKFRGTANGFPDFDLSEWKQVKYICSDTIGNYAAIKEDGTVLCTCNYLPVDKWHDIIMLGFNRYYDYYDQEGMNGENSHIVGLQKDGKVVAAGMNSFGECDVENWDSIVDVAAGENFTIGLREDGTVIATGDNSYEQCNVEGWNDIVDVAAARFSSYGLRNDGTIVATGYIYENKYEHAEGPNWENIIAIKAYNDRSSETDYIVGLKNDGTLVTNSPDYYTQKNSTQFSDLVSFDCATWGRIASLDSNGNVYEALSSDEKTKIASGLKAEKVEWAESKTLKAENKIITHDNIQNAEYTDGDFVLFGHYPQTSEGKDSTSIKWKILAVESDKILLLSDKVLDVKPFHNNTKTVEITWEDCTLRSWLNKDFMKNAFSSDEQSAIVTTTNNADGSTTNDRVFLLSNYETEKLNDIVSDCYQTDYAFSQHGPSASFSSYWWTRTVRRDHQNVVLKGRSDCRFDQEAGVRPAIWVDKSILSNIKQTDVNTINDSLLSIAQKQISKVTLIKYGTHDDSGINPLRGEDDIIPYYMDETFSPFIIPFFPIFEGDKYKMPEFSWGSLISYFSSQYVPSGETSLRMKYNSSNEDVMRMRLDNFEIGTVFELFEFTEDDEHSLKVLKDDSFIKQTSALLPNKKYLGELQEEEYVTIDDHPARLCIWYYDANAMDVSSASPLISSISYARNDKLLVLLFTTKLYNDNWYDHPWPEIPRITMNDLRIIANLIQYDGTKTEFNQSDGEFNLSIKNIETILAAGDEYQIDIEYNNPQKAKKMIQPFSKNKKSKGYETIIWNVQDAETGENIQEINIDENGMLSIDKSLTNVKKIVINAESKVFHTKASLSATVIPAVDNLIVDKDELQFYAGTDMVDTVKILIEPSTIPPIGISWKTKKDGIVDVTINDDGIATIKPLAAGKTIITITEPGGKSVQVNAKVLVPVENVELTLSGKQVPGGKVTVRGNLFPKSADIKNVEWSLNVDDSVATINEKGQIIISKGATVGTKIIVTCKALGAAEPVISTIEFEINEK